jgi:WD40 repeat protein
MPFRAFGVSWFPDGQWLAVGGVSGSDFNHGVLTVLPTEPGPARWTRTDVEPVDDVAVSPDGRWLAVAGWRSVVVSAADGTPRFPAFDQFQSHVVAFSPDGSLAAWDASVDGGNAIKVVDAASGTVRLALVPDDPFRWAFSPDSRRFAIIGVETVDVFDVNTSELVQLPLDRFAVDLEFSPDGRRLAAACADGTLRIFDTATNLPTVTVPVDEDALLSLAFSPDSRWVAVGCNPGIGIYSVVDGSLRLPGIAEVAGFDKVVFSPDLKYFAAKSADGLAMLDAATGAPVWKDTIPGFVEGLGISPDGRRVAAGTSNDHETGALHIYDTGIDVSRHQHDASITALAVSPAGTPLIAFADNTPVVTVLAAESGARLARKPVPGTLAELAFADGAQSVAIAGSGGVRLFSILGDRTWKVDTIGPVNAIAVGGTAGEWVAAGAGRSARVLSTADGHERWVSPHPQTVARIAMSADGRWVATGCADRRTRLLDATTGTEAFGTAGDGKIFDVAFSPRGTLLATANEDGSVVVVDTATTTVRARITRPFGCALLAFNHDETLLASAWDDNTVSIHDLTAKDAPPELQRLSYASPVSTLAFDPAGPALCIATGTPTVTLVDPQSGADLRWLPHAGRVRQVAFSADGTLVATAADDNIVRVLPA